MGRKKLSKETLMDTEKRVKYMDQRLVDGQNDLVYLIEVLERLKKMQKNRLKLGEYYAQDWQKDRDLMLKENPNELYPVLNDDLLYHTLEDHQVMMQKVILKCATYIDVGWQKSDL